MQNVYLTETVRVRNYFSLQFEHKYRLDFEGVLSSFHVLLRTKPHDNSHLKMNVFCRLTAVNSKVLVTGATSVFIPCSKFTQPDASKYVVAFAKLTAEFLRLSSYNLRWVSALGVERKSADLHFVSEQMYL
jgi:hypothetical protein